MKQTCIYIYKNHPAIGLPAMEPPHMKPHWSHAPPWLCWWGFHRIPMWTSTGHFSRRGAAKRDLSTGSTGLDPTNFHWTSSSTAEKTSENQTTLQCQPSTPYFLGGACAKLDYTRLHVLSLISMWLHLVGGFTPICKSMWDHPPCSQTIPIRI